MMQKIIKLPLILQIMSIALLLGLYTVISPFAVGATQSVDTDAVIHVQFAEHLESLKQNPPIPTGALDPYKPLN